MLDTESRNRHSSNYLRKCPNQDKNGFSNKKRKSAKVDKVLNLWSWDIFKKQVSFCDNVVQVKARDCIHFREATGGESGYGTDRCAE